VFAVIAEMRGLKEGRGSIVAGQTIEDEDYVSARIGKHFDE
jgi:hypothetical protein